MFAIIAKMIAQDTRPRVIAVLSNRLAFFHELLARPVDASSLATFRFLFGGLMVWEVVRYFEHDFISAYYIEPTFYFTYEFFPFVSPLPGQWMVGLFVAMGLFALGIALGFYYKLSSFLFFLSYTYVFLLDKTPYNNHYYLISLLSFLFIFVDAQHWISIDRFRPFKPGRDTIPFWQLFLLRAQIFIVYFYGGIAKLNSDWLSGQPVRLWLAEQANHPWVGPFFTTEWAVYFFSYGGLLFDLSIGFLLLWRPTRLFAFLAVLFFHLTNNWLFSIGIFPFLGIATTILFVEPDWPRRILNRFNRRLLSLPIPPALSPPKPTSLRIWTIAFVAVYLALQMFIPLRHWLYPGEVSWTEEGHRFAWHMKLRYKEGHLHLEITDPTTGQTWPVKLEDDLTPRQISKMSTRPDMILQYVHYLKEKLQRSGLDNPIIKADARVSLNGRPYQPLIDPNINLAEVSFDPFAPAAWILPLDEKVSSDPSPVLYLLTVMVALLTNIGLTLSSYFVIDYYRKNEFFAEVGCHPDQSGTAGPVMGISLLEVAGLIKVTSSILPYPLILFSLAGWTVTRESAWLSVALFAAIFAAAWNFYLAAFLASRIDRSSSFCLAPSLVSLVIGLFLLKIIIVALQL